MMYVCNPMRNTACRKTDCLFLLCGECFSTLKEKYAVRCEGKPVSFPDGLYEAVKEYMVPRWKESMEEAIDMGFLYGKAGDE